MRLDLSWLFRSLAWVLVGWLAVTAGCSAPADKSGGSSGAGPAGSAAQNQTPAPSTESPAGPDDIYTPVPEPPVHAVQPVQSPPIIIQQVAPEPAPDIPLAEPPKPSKTKPGKKPPKAVLLPETKVEDLDPTPPARPKGSE
jgi:hypothetical protein